MPGIHSVKELLGTILDENLIDDIIFKQWVSVDRSTLYTSSKTADEFTELFCEKIEALVPHSFLSTQQSSFFSECKASLQPGTLLVQADFSENYAIIIKDAAQGFHWNNSFVVYFKHLGEEHYLSFVVISDCLQHDTVAVYLFQKKLIAFLKQVLPFTPQKIIYFELRHSTKTGRTL